MAKKLLLADDSLTIQKVVGIVFANLDYQLLVADNGDAALELARKELPDLIIADVGMPGKDGIALCREIKSDNDLSATPVLLLPGAFENFDEAKASDAGASGWITKPFESQALIDKVEECLAAAPVKAFTQEPAEEPASIAMEEPELVVAEEPEPEKTFESEPAAEDASEPSSDFEFSAVPEPVSFAEPAIEEPVVEEAADDNDDIWDAVTFEEEDLQSESAVLEIEEPTPVASTEEPIQFEGSAPEPEEAEEEILDLTEDNIFELEDDAIIEEVTVEEPEPEAYDFEAEPVSEPEPVAEPVVASGAVDSLTEAETEIESEVEPEPESEFLLDAEDVEPLEEVAEPAPEPEPDIAEVPAFAEEPAVSTSAAAQVEEQLRGLDEIELEQVVRKVAGSMIEKLASEMLEQVVWEVVPDLAESMIKDEIRKIHEGAV